MPTNLDSPAGSDRRGAYLLLAAAITIGSFAFTLVKVALRDLSPLSLAAGRVVASAVVFVGFVSLSPGRRRPILPQHRLRVVLCGLGGSAVFHVLFAWGQLRVSVAVSAVVMSTFPAMVAIGEVAFLHHRLRGMQVVGLALTTGGCAVIGLAADGSGGTLIGAAAIAGSTLVWAAVTVATRSIATVYDSWWLNTPGTVLGAVLMIVLVAPRAHEFGDLSLKGWLVVIWLGSASSAFIYYAMARAMTVLSATATSSLSTIVTPASVMVAWFFLGDAPTLWEVLGGTVALAGAVLVSRRPTIDLDDR